MLRQTLSLTTVVTLALMALGLSTATKAADYRDAPEPLPWSNGSSKDGYPVPQPPPGEEPHRSYKDDAPPPPAPRRTSECLSKYGIQHALHQQGFHDFDRVEMRGPVAYMAARTDNGRSVDLEVDSCTGAVIEAHPVTTYYERPYYEQRPAVGVYLYGGRGYGYGGHGGYGHHWR